MADEADEEEPLLTRWNSIDMRRAELAKLEGDYLALAASGDTEAANAMFAVRAEILDCRRQMDAIVDEMFSSGRTRSPDEISRDMDRRVHQARLLVDKVRQCHRKAAAGDPEALDALLQVRQEGHMTYVCFMNHIDEIARLHGRSLD